MEKRNDKDRWRPQRSYVHYGNGYMSLPDLVERKWIHREEVKKTVSSSNRLEGDSYPTCA